MCNEIVVLCIMRQGSFDLESKIASDDIYIESLKWFTHTVISRL